MSRRSMPARTSKRSIASASPSKASSLARPARWLWSSTSIRRWRRTRTEPRSTASRCPTRSTRSANRRSRLPTARRRDEKSTKHDHEKWSPVFGYDQAQIRGLTERADAHAKPHHDYHLVEPSPWPAIGSVSAFVMAVGAITWMHHMFSAAPLVFGAGVIGVLYTFLSWWRDVIKEAQVEGYHTRVVQISHRYGMILFIASEVMFFVAWFWAYFDVALFPADVHQVARPELIGGVCPPHPAADGSFRGTFDPWHLPLL